MRIKKLGSAWTLTLALACVLPACSDDDTHDTEDGGEDAGASTGSPDSGTTGTSDGGTTGDEDGGTTGDEDGGTTGDEDGGTTGDEDVIPALPATLALVGCEEANVGPLCTVEQDEEQFSANCGGVIYTGSVDVDGNLDFTRPDETTEEGATLSLDCQGNLIDGRVSAECMVDTSAAGDTPASTDLCMVRSKPQVLPGIGCMELPSTLTDVVLCVEGDDEGGATVTAGACAVIQDGCTFQAECENDLLLTGSVGASSMSFDQELVALADAAVREEGDTPAFVAGDDAEHGCSVEVDGTTLMGECAAGRAGRGSDHTSVCSVSGSAGEVATCDAVGPVEKLWALESCDILKNGEGDEVAGIGEPVCAFRQNNCIWEIQCGNDPTLHFAGRLDDGATKVEWTLPTGTPCEMSFDDDGNPTGTCTVAGEDPCELGSLTAEPGVADECPAVMDGADFRSRGCGNPGGENERLECRDALQHGCNFMAICSFTDRYPNEIFAGETSYDDDDLGRMDFNGLNDWQCHAVEPDQDAIEGGQDADEWRGDCTVPGLGNACRRTENPEEAENPFYGLQMFLNAE